MLYPGSSSTAPSPHSTGPRDKGERLIFALARDVVQAAVKALCPHPYTRFPTPNTAEPGSVAIFFILRELSLLSLERELRGLPSAEEALWQR